MTANYVARETGYAMHGWGHGDRATNESFAPIETYAERFDALLRDVKELGFDTVDIGSVAESWRVERDQPAYVVRQTSEELGDNLARATR